MLSKGGGGVSGRGTSRTDGHKHSSSNHKSREHGSSNHRQARGDRWTESSSSTSWTSGHRGVHGRGGRLLEQDEEKISNYEMEMKPLQPRDSTTQKPHGHGEERHGHSHAHGEGRSHAVQRQRHKNREGREGREGKEGGKDSVHKLDRPGEKMDSRPLRRDLTLSPHLKSSPITPEQQDHSLT
ncbi:junctophilin-3 [Lates japonicus]|uniref:Junctophilin-3 n=1 Tax=Lates japonicus TaxID=270547 RepID=A0AAD3N7E0_LATJO|nr:junctophilin-3 [Lates japonicus]